MKRLQFSMVRIGLLVTFLVLPGRYIPSTIANQSTSRLALAREVALAGPSLASVKASSTAAAVPNIITLSTSGFSPAVLTATFGADVLWVNATSVTYTLVSGEPVRLFLPLVLRSSGVRQAMMTSSPASGAPPVGTNGMFRATLPPGGVFTYSVFTSGVVPYFLADAPHFSGRVIVQLDLPPDPVEVAPLLD